MNNSIQCNNCDSCYTECCCSYTEIVLIVTIGTEMFQFKCMVGSVDSVTVKKS